MKDFQLQSYHYELPSELIAQYPLDRRSDSRLLVYDQETGQITHSLFKELSSFLPKPSLLVFNQSKVIPARLFGKKESGGEAEIFLISLIPEENLYRAMIRASGKRKENEIFLVHHQKIKLVSVVGDGTFLVQFQLDHQELLNWLEEVGNIPLPPYIRDGLANESDKERYQTVYAKESGSVAAPTAGLHFTPELLHELKIKNIQTAEVTLHVGAGTFAPVKVENILEHKMHGEWFEVPPSTQEKLKTNHHPVIAVGTTSLRTLESCFQNGSWFFPTAPVQTNIFLHPGKEVHSIDGLITNFHLPESSLLMLVSSLIGREKLMEIYQVAIQEKYRFFSYGDAMLILRKKRVL